MAEAKDFTFDKAGAAKDCMVDTTAATDEFNKQYGGDADHDPCSKGGNRELKSEHTSYVFLVEFIRVMDLYGEEGLRNPTQTDVEKLYALRNPTQTDVEKLYAFHKEKFEFH
ncbi:hypothetical protein Tco_1322528, partial [Tanacetum coccineum]